MSKGHRCNGENREQEGQMLRNENGINTGVVEERKSKKHMCSEGPRQ